MRRTPLRRFGLMLLAVVVTTMGMTTPARAADTGVIAGQITYNGAPVANAFIYASNVDTGDGGSAVADGSGRYTVTDLVPGPYLVQIFAEGHPVQYAPNTPSWDAAQLYAVNENATTTANATLIPFGTVVGRLTDGAGGGVADVSVAVASTSDWSISNRGTTDANGNYAVPVPVGEVTVEFELGGSSQYAYGKREDWEAQTFVVAAGKSLTVNDTLLPTGSASGTVLTAGGQPAENIDVAFSLKTGNGFANTLTDSSGGYRIDNLAPGQYEVSFTLPGSGATMYHPHVLGMDNAQTVTVVADQVVDVDETLFPTGGIAGRLTRTDGTTGVDHAGVMASFALYQGVSGVTDENGDYRIEPVFTGSYRVNFTEYESGEFDQWATGKLSYETANTFAVTAGATTTVNDKLLATGSVKVTAKDATTGATIPDFSVGVLYRYGDATSGSVTLADVPVGTHPLRVSAQGYAESDGVVNVTVTAGQQASATVTLNRVASVQGKVVNAAGAPVAGVCVAPIAISRFSLPEGCGYETDAAGNYLMPLWNGAGSYHLFAIPDRDGPYGAQWVGASGGTGDPRKAAVITAAAGQWVAAPTIKLDRAGTITGTVKSDSGQPIKWGSVGVYSPHPGLGNGYGHVSIDANGRYSTDFLGPYNWALIFAAEGHATQWSGGATNRFSAQTVKVTSDATTTYNYTMKVGSLVKGKIKLVDGSAPDGRFIVSHAATGEYIAVGETIGGVYQMRVLTPVPAWFAFEKYDAESSANLLGTSRIELRGNVTLDFCGVSATTFEVCGSRPPRGSTGDTKVPAPALPPHRP
ncbi:MSCRAMM family protein [Catellatospora vulcania]|uniref:MSCRAMM family protein n=1 Tax=Catellatospora vulcania TaxID=1460450 RepID=UPI0012D3DD00|nr:carboxypeptidase regulatory-like domain-containing protein [Catellatospora vulcania]